MADYRQTDTAGKLQTKSSVIGATDAFTSFEKFNSASRTAMVVSQRSQTIIPDKGGDPKRILTCYELEESKYAMGGIMRHDAMSKGIVSKYQTGMGMNSIKKNTLKTLVYINQDTGILDAINIKAYERTHDVFGYDMKEAPAVRSAGMNNYAIRKGTRLTSANTIGDQGVYSSTLQVNTAFIAHAAGIEDGIWISKSAIERMRPMAHAKVSFAWGSSYFLRNLYGNTKFFKGYPGPGESIKESGLVVSLCKKDPIFDAVNLLATNISKPSMFDKKIYAPPESKDVKVADVDVLTTTKDRKKLLLTPVGMEEHSQIFASHKSEYYDSLLKIYENFRKETNYRGNIGPELWSILVDAIADKPNDPRARLGSGPRGSIQRTNRGTPIDEWQVDIELEWLFELGEGGKASNMSGSKGVFVKISPDEEMPTDAYGRRADIAVYGGSVIARLNYGQLYEQYINACADTVQMKLREMLAGGQENEAWEWLLGWYNLASPETFNTISKKSGRHRRRHLDLVCKHHISLLIPADNSYVGPDYIRKLRAYCPPIKTPVTFTNFDGKKVTTKVDVLIGAMEWMVLDKSSFKPMAVCVAKRQAHGLPSTLNKSTKTAAPVNMQPSRGYAEAECRAIGNAVGGKPLQDVIDLSVNPEALNHALNKIWHSPNPMAETGLIDRVETPYGSGRSVGVPKNILRGIGIIPKRAEGTINAS